MARTAERVQLKAVGVLLRLVRGAPASVTAEIVSVYRNDAARGASPWVAVCRARVEPLGSARNRERMTARKVGFFALVVAIVTDSAHNVAGRVFAGVVVSHRRRARLQGRPRGRVGLFFFFFFFVFVFFVFFVVRDTKTALKGWDDVAEVLPKRKSVTRSTLEKVPLFGQVEPLAGVLVAHEYQTTLNKCAAPLHETVQSANVHELEKASHFVRLVRPRHIVNKTTNHARRLGDVPKTSEARDVPADLDRVVGAPVIRRLNESGQAHRIGARLALRHDHRPRRTDQKTSSDRSDPRRVRSDHGARHTVMRPMAPHRITKTDSVNSFECSGRRRSITPKQRALVHLVDEERIYVEDPASENLAHFVNPVIHSRSGVGLLFPVLLFPFFFLENPYRRKKFKK